MYDHSRPDLKTIAATSTANLVETDHNLQPIELVSSNAEVHVENAPQLNSCFAIPNHTEIESDVFDRTEPLTLYFNQRKIRLIYLSLIIATSIATSIFYCSGVFETPYVALPMVAPLVCLLVLSCFYTGRRRYFISINPEGITFNLPLKKMLSVSWSKINSVSLERTGPYHVLKFRIENRHVIEVISDFLQLSATEIIEHIQIYSSLADHTVVCETLNELEADKKAFSRFAQHSIKTVAVTVAIMAIGYIAIHKLKEQHRESLQHTLLTDLKTGDFYTAMVDKARLLAFDAQYKDALEQYMEYYDRSRNDATQSGVRNSFVTSEIVALGDKFPPAIDALKSRRDHREQRIIEAVADKEDVKEWYSICHYLKEQNHISELLYKLQNENLPSKDLVLKVVGRYTKE